MSANTRCHIGPVPQRRRLSLSQCLHARRRYELLQAPNHGLGSWCRTIGGGYIAGAGYPYDGASLLSASGQKAIVVNFNHRLGASGFFSNEETLKESDGANFGPATRIRRFSGSRGQSCGDARCCTGRGDLQGANVLACLRKVPARAIFNATQSLNSYPTIDQVLIKRPPFRSLLTPLAPSKMSRVPTIIGANTDDGWYFTMTASEASQFDSFIRTTFSLMNEQERNKLAELYPASAFATPHHRTSEIFSDRSFVCAGEIFSDLLSLTVPNTYRYRFNYPSNEFGIPLVLHAKDLDYVFDRKYNLPNNTDVMTVVGQFQEFSTNFAIYGSPNGGTKEDDSRLGKPSAPVWQRYNVFAKKPIILSPTLGVEAHSI